MICSFCGRQINNEIGICPDCDTLGKSLFYLVPKSEKGKIGFADENSGKYIINPIFDTVTEDETYNGIYDAYTNGKLYRINPQCQENIVAFWDEQGDRKFLTKTGIVIDFPIRIRNGYGIYGRNNKKGIINENYEIIVPPIFDFASTLSSSFEDYVICLRIYGDVEINCVYFLKSDRFFSQEMLDDKLGIYELSQKTIYWFYDRNILKVVAPFLSRCMIRPGIRRYYVDGKYGLITDDGRIITSSIYDFLIEENENRLLFKYKVDGRFGFLDENGKPYKKKKSEISNHAYYQRVCQRCGEIWFSSVAEEENLEPIFRKGFWTGIAKSISDRSYVDHLVNERFDKEKLAKLRSCPKCGSRNYDEEYI